MAMASLDADIELEEGECSSGSDDAQGPANSRKTIADQQNAYQSSTYHTRIPQIVINSDESEKSSDEEYPSVIKRSRSPAPPNYSQSGAWESGNSSSGVFVNPLLNRPIASKTVNVGSSLSNFPPTKKKNNVWCSVLTEQTLSQDIKGFMVEPAQDNFRDVESYDYKKALEDDRPNLEIDSDEYDNAKDDPFGGVVDLEREVKRQENRKRKRKAKERLGRRSFNKWKQRDLKVTEKDSIEDVAKAIVTALKEENITLFNRIVETIGQEMAIRLFYMTEDVEEAGGMMTNDGFRRRTPGGVYIQLLKSESLVSSEKITHIFQEEEQKWLQIRKERRKIKKAARRKWKQQRKNKMDIDRPETPTPTEDLEALSAVDSNNEFDNTDLPERPATPEPKDDSSDGEEEDEDDEEDISVVIAKAKAALLKRQQELVKESQGADSEEPVDESQSSPSCRSMTSTKDMDSKEDACDTSEREGQPPSSDVLPLTEDTSETMDDN